MDLEKSEKLPREHRYFNVSTLWIPYFRWVIRLLYRLGVPHEAATLVSILCGVVAAGLFSWGLLIPAAIALHLKDVFDACDGALARLTGRGHLVGRYVDSLGDFVCLTLVMLAIGLRASRAGDGTAPWWMAAAVISTFLQCSFFNYYQLAYAEQCGEDRLLSRRDEAHRSDAGGSAAGRRRLLGILRFLYAAIYGWQDRLVAQVDQRLHRWNAAWSDRAWHGDRIFMTLISPLCFGTHIFVIIVFALLGGPGYALAFIASVMNAYLLLILSWRGLRPPSPTAADDKRQGVPSPRASRAGR